MSLALGQSPFDESAIVQSEWDSNECCDAECDTCCRLFGLAAPSDPCFDSFVSPMTNPLFFEDPRTLTEARFIFAHHDVPSNVLGGGDVQFFALQLRAALTDRLSLIATKDGFLLGQPSAHADGWADIAAGLKYNVVSNPETQFLFSIGATYEVPLGSHRAFQGADDGDIHVFASWAKQLGCRGHWVSGTGYRVALDTERGSDMWYWSNHFDYEVANGFYPFLEVNWFTWTRSGNGPISGLEGGDIYNLGSTGVAGNDIVTMAPGIKYKPYDNVEIGVAYEVPLTERRDLLESRFTADLILRY